MLFVLLLLVIAGTNIAYANGRSGTQHELSRRSVTASLRSAQPVDDRAAACSCDCCLTQLANQASTSKQLADVLECAPRSGTEDAVDDGDGRCSAVCTVPTESQVSFASLGGEVDYGRYCQSFCRPVSSTLNMLCVGKEYEVGADNGIADPPLPKAPSQKAMTQVGSILNSRRNQQATGATSDTVALALAKGQMLQAKMRAEMAGKAARVAKEAYERVMHSSSEMSEDAAKVTVQTIIHGAQSQAADALAIRQKYEADARTKAIKAALKIAKVYKDAMVRDGNLANTWSQRSQEFATAANQRSAIAASEASRAEQYQLNGDPQLATTYILQSQQAEDQAAAFQKNADAAQATSDSIRKGTNWYPLAEAAAAANMLVKSMPPDVLPPPMPVLP